VAPSVQTLPERRSIGQKGNQVGILSLETDFILLGMVGGTYQMSHVDQTLSEASLDKRSDGGWQGRPGTPGWR
jgi:hypothetical protein